MAVPLTLRIYKGTQLVGTKEFAREIIKIGRLSSAHLSLEDDKISRIHSVIQVSAENQVSILDMGSAEGTFVNGKRISKGNLRSGDEITLGGTRLVLEFGGLGTELGVPSAQPSPVSFAPGVSPNSRVPVTDGNAALALQPSPVSSPPAPSLAMAPALIEPPPAGEPAPSAPPDFRRRRHSGPLADVQLSRRGRGAPPAAADATEDAVEVRVFWGDTLVASTLRLRPPQITIGEDPRADLSIPGAGLGAERFAIVKSQGDQVQLRFTRAMEGEFQPRDQSPTRLADLVARGQVRAEDGAYALPLPDGSFAWVSAGALRIEVERTRSAKAVVVPFWEGLDYRFLNLALAMCFAMLAFIISAATFPFDTDTTADDLFRGPSMTKVTFKPPEKVKNPFLEKLQADAKRGQEKGQQAEKHAGDEGKAGRKNAPQKTGKTAPKAIDVNAKEVVKNSALLKALGASGGLSAIVGSGGLGGDLKGALGNMFGPRVGEAGGLSGLGLRGTGAGGGGFGNTIGIGDIGTKGRGGGLNGYGVGVGLTAKKTGSDVAISSGSPVVEGSMDKELIRKVIHEHRNQVRYCYESELQRHPGLNGKVTIKFTIAASGQVQKSAVDNSSLGNLAVENCIVARVYQWQFPKPKGGGIVQVSYPFLLKESGD